MPGTEDARNNTSQLVNQTSNLASLGGSETDWQSTKSCIEDRLSPFNIEVTDVDPGTNTLHSEIVLTGSRPEELGLSPTVKAIASSVCSPGSRGIGFVFSDSIADATKLCQRGNFVAGQLHGVDITDGCGDASSFDDTCTGSFEFTDSLRTCSGGSCRCGGTMQNSFATMAASVGLRDCTP